jgi:hypothetical protein
MKQIITLAALIVLTLQLAGCGGGGGGASVKAPSVAQVTLSTANSGGSATIGLIDVTLNLPAGVSVKTVSASDPTVASGAITLQGAAASQVGAVLQATLLPGTPGKVRIHLLLPSGIAPDSAFAVVNCDLAAGSSPVPADFSITPNVAATTGIFDLTGTGLPAVTAQFSVLFS